MASQNRTLSPLTGNNRVQYLDVLRGIAILFIFLANITYLSGGHE